MTVAEAAAASRPLRAASWMAGAVLSFAAMTLAGRALAAELDTFEIMAWRSAIGLPIVAAAMLAGPGWRGALTAQPGLHAGRNLIHFAGQNLWFYGVATIPLAQLTALEFTSPIWVALLAPVLLGESLTRAKLGAALLGFAGAVVIAQPGVAPVSWGHAAALGAAMGFALTNIATKRIMRRDAALCVLFWMTASQCAMGLAVAGATGGLTVPSAPLGPWTAIAGLSGLSAHFCLTRALEAAPASVVAPMEFARLPVIAAAALIVYGEPIALSLVVGAAMIVAANAATLLAERNSRG